MYYFSETQDANSKTKAEKLNTKDLRTAKVLASKRKFFQGTTLIIGDQVDANSFITRVIAYKEPGQVWVNCED